MDNVEFDRLVHEEGFGEPAQKEYDPNATSEMHTHDFSVVLLVLGGEFKLRTEQGVESFLPGDICRLKAGVSHAEEAGPEGARIVLSKKSS